MESKIIICRIYHWDHESYDASYQIIDGYKFIVNKEESYCDIWKLDSYETNCEQAELLEKYFVEENFDKKLIDTDYFFFLSVLFVF